MCYSLLIYQQPLTKGTTLTNLPESKSLTGTAFYQPTEDKCFDLPIFNEVWFKFDIYWDGYTRWSVGNNIFFSGIRGDGGNIVVRAYTNLIEDFRLSGNRLMTIRLHLAEGLIELWINGALRRYTENVYIPSLSDLCLQSEGEGALFSNIIISNREINSDEGYQIISFNTQRKIKKPYQSLFDVQRKFINPVIVPFIGEHFAHFVPSLKVCRDKVRTIILPTNSTAYIRTIASGVLEQVFTNA